MQGITKERVYQLMWGMLYGLGVVSLIGLAVMGQIPEVVAGWPGPPRHRMPTSKRMRRVRRRCEDAAVSRLTEYGAQSWRLTLLRSLVLWGLWEWSGEWGPPWLRLLPWGLWLWRGIAVGWPAVRGVAVWNWVERGLWEVQRLALVTTAGAALGHWQRGEAMLGGVGLGCVICQGEAPHVEVVREEDGSYQATLCGHFILTVPGDHPFRMRLLVLFLSLLDEPEATRSSRRTRDGRTPFVRQVQLAEWVGVPQPHISRWLRYWHNCDWADLLSLHTPEVLTAELVDRIVEVCATFPTWGVERVYEHLRQTGATVTPGQVEQAVRQSGWRRLQQTLRERYDLGPGVLRLREEWLVGELLGQVRELLTRVEKGGGAAVAVQGMPADLMALAGEAGVTAPAPVKALPWLLRVEQVLLGQWQMATDDEVRCPYCGSNQVARKSATPRMKKYYDEARQLCQIAVYRYYCRNLECDKGSFTHLPAGLVPYSPYGTEAHLLAVQMYTWGHSTYRRTGTALGVTSLTAWRWVNAWGYELLPVAALFGVVRSSGVVGVDEKYVLVPKNDKVAGDRRRWMYVYLAVDVWTYDLLHIAIYPYNNAESAQAFLLALRAKGYHPHVIVTDLRQDYGGVIAQVFPHAVHHECIFHALKQLQEHLRDVYGPDYANKHPEVLLLKQQIYRIFDTTTAQEAAERYAAVLAWRQNHDQEPPAADAIFDFLAQHWPKLVNSIGSDTIPATNNAVELVIRRFDQHYQNFCGFESLPDAQRYLAVFEKVYRFTPFSQDAQPRIRGKSPLQLAGYDVANLPMSTLCAGLSILWPMHTSEPHHVPTL